MTPKDLLDNFDKLVRELAVMHLEETQGGKLGPPTLEDLNRCGALHVFLENRGTIESIVKKIP